MIPKGPKKFICLGGYKDIINNLKERGWIQQTNPNSMDYIYAFTLKTVDIKFLFLRPYHLVNHFTKNGLWQEKMAYVKLLEIYILKTLILIIFIIDVMIYQKKMIYVIF